MILESTSLPIVGTVPQAPAQFNFLFYTGIEKYVFFSLEKNSLIFLKQRCWVSMIAFSVFEIQQFNGNSQQYVCVLNYMFSTFFISLKACLGSANI